MKSPPEELPPELLLPEELLPEELLPEELLPEELPLEDDPLEEPPLLEVLPPEELPLEDDPLEELLADALSGTSAGFLVVETEPQACSTRNAEQINQRTNVVADKRGSRGRKNLKLPLVTQEIQIANMSL
ncbi:MAG TPA: hypothetical protein VIE42_11505 [Steroidobacteraceae bacterium]